MRGMFFLIVALMASVQAYSAIRTISVAGGNYNATTTWDEGIIPTSSDTVVARGDSTSGNLTINVSSVAKAINFTKYFGTVTFDNTLTVSGFITLDTTMNFAGNSALIVNTGATLRSNGKALGVPLTLSGTSQTFTLADNWTLLAPFTLSGTTAATINDNTIYIKGDLTEITNIAVGGTTNFVFNGKTIWTSGTGGRYIRNNITVNTTDTLTVSGPVGFHTGTFTYTAGTVITAGSTLYLDGSCTLNTDGIIWNNVTYNVAGTATLTSNLRVAGTIAINAAYVFNGDTMNILGNIANSGSTIGTTIFIFDGNGTWSGNGAIRNTTTIKTSGTLTITGSVAFNVGTLTYSAGTVAATGSTLVVSSSNATLNTNGITWNNVTINSAITVTLSSNLTLTGTLNVGSVGHTTTINGNTIYAGGGITNSVTNGIVRGTTNIVLNGTGNVQGAGTGTLRNDLTINTSGTITFSGYQFRYAEGTLTYVAGTVVPNSYLVINAASTTLNTPGMTWGRVVLSNTITVILAANLYISDTLFLGTGGNTTNIENNMIYASGSVATSGLTTGAVRGTTKIVMNGKGVLTTSGVTTGAFMNAIDINTTDTIRLIGTFNYRASALSYIAGTVITAGSTLDLTGSPTVINLPGIVLNNLKISSNTTVSLSSNITCSGNLELGSANHTTVINGNNIYVGGNLLYSGVNGVVSGTTNIILNGTGTLSAPAVTAGGLRNNLEVNTSGTITISGGVRYNTGTLKYTSGTVVSTGSTIIIQFATILDLNGLALNRIAISTSSVVVTLKSEIKISGDLAVFASYAAHSAFVSDSSGVRRKLTLLHGATQEDMTFCNATDIDSSDGQTIWSYKGGSPEGTFPNSLNWSTYSPATTKSQTF